MSRYVPEPMTAQPALPARESRRSVLRRTVTTAATAAAGAAGAQALLRPNPVAAADVVLGAVNTAPAATTIRTTQALNSAKAIVGLVTFAGAGPSTAGVQGQSNATNGNGVFGVGGPGVNAKGVWGRSVAGRGVYGEATGATGVNYGVYGESKSTTVGGAGVYGKGYYGVRGVSTTTGVYGTGNAYGVFGDGSTGVYGAGGFGVHGVGTVVGVHGEGTVVGVQAVTQGDGTAVNAVVRSGPGYGSAVAGTSYASATSGASPVGVRGVATGTGGIGVLGVRSNSATYAGYFTGPVHVEGNLTKSTGSFLIDHPQDPARRTLEHSFVEAPERLNIYSGTATLDARGRATIRLPRYFRALNTGYRYQLTPLGAPAPSLHVARQVERNSFAIAGGVAGQEVCWIVTGVRQDAYSQAHPLRVERSKRSNDQGKYLNPEVFGQPRSAAMYPIRRLRPLRRPQRPSSPAAET